ncbi:MAG: ABC transporter permease [Desulfomonilaceae bacterium]
MYTQVIPISDHQLAFTGILILVTASISAIFQLGLLKSLVWGTIRCVLQLSVVGYALAWIFSVNRFEIVILIIALMALFAARTATRRTPNVSDFPTLLAFLALVTTTYLVSTIVSLAIIRPTPWYDSRIVVPISGMILGNAVNGVTLSIDRLYGEVRSHCHEVEALLSMGASPWEAVHELVREAIRAAMTPTINALMVVGVVSLPGMMTGQILGGANPVEAARYQIVVMLMISCAAALGSMVLVGLSFRRLFTKGEALQPNLFRSDS